MKRQTRPRKMPTSITRTVILASEEAQSQKEAHISSTRRKRNEEQKMLKTSTNSPDRRRADETQLWVSMTKTLTNYTLERYICLPRWFTKEIGFQESCKITLKSSGCQRSWEVNYLVEKKGRCNLCAGWKMFCQDLGLKEGDKCTFNVIKRSLWNVDIERC